MSEKLMIIGSSEGARAQAQLHSDYFTEHKLKWNCESMQDISQEEAQKIIEKKDYTALILDGPYKELGAQCADIKAASAKLAFGAGLLIRKDEILLGYELEGSSRAAYLSREGFDYRDALVLVSGEGPSALADVLAASLYGARKVVLISNNKQEAKRRLRAFVTEFGKLAYATIDLPPADENQLSLRGAYEHTSFSFGSYRTSTKIFEEADLVIDHREEPDSAIQKAYAASIQEALMDIFRIDL